MFRKNQRHLQPPLVSSVQDMPSKHRERLDASWAGAFYRECFCRIREETFSVLYVDFASRPNTPVNVLVGLELLKAGFGWSDEELYDAFTFNVQVRYALGYHNLGEGDFDLRTVYNFRQRLACYHQEHGVNLLDETFQMITDEQLKAFGVRTGYQRLDSTQIASNIRDVSRLQLAVEGHSASVSPARRSRARDLCGLVGAICGASIGPVCVSGQGPGSDPRSPAEGGRGAAPVADGDGTQVSSGTGLPGGPTLLR